MISKQEKYDQFEWWITCIPDKVILLKKRFPKEIGDKLDYTISSLNLLEKHLLDNYTFDTIQSDKELWDACAGYVGSSFRKIIPQSKWFIELDDQKDVFYNMPVLIVGNSLMPPMSPHSVITAMLERRTGKFLKTVFDNYANSITD